MGKGASSEVVRRFTAARADVFAEEKTRTILEDCAARRASRSSVGAKGWRRTCTTAGARSFWRREERLLGDTTREATAPEVQTLRTRTAADKGDKDLKLPSAVDIGRRHVRSTPVLMVAQAGDRVEGSGRRRALQRSSFPPRRRGRPWAICTAFTLDPRKLGAVRAERVNELAVALEQRRCRDAGLLRAEIRAPCGFAKICAESRAPYGFSHGDAEALRGAGVRA